MNHLASWRLDAAAGPVLSSSGLSEIRSNRSSAEFDFHHTTLNLKPAHDDAGRVVQLFSHTKMGKKEMNRKGEINTHIHSLTEIMSSLELGLQPQPSIDDFIHLMHRCRKERDVENATRLYAYMQLKGVDTHNSLGNYLVPMLVEVGCIDKAHGVFENLECRNEFSWTFLITAYVKVGKPKLALALYEDMVRQNSVRPNGYTVVAALKACTNLKDSHRGAKIHQNLVEMGLLEDDIFVGNTLIDMYAKCGSLSKAWEVFNNLCVRDVVSWNVLLTGYIEHGKDKDAIICFRKMMVENFYPNSVTFICCLKACSNVVDIVMAQHLHLHIVKSGLDADIAISRTLVDTYAKCGLFAEAQLTLDTLSVPDVISWTALIGGYVTHGHNENALKCFQQMRAEGVVLDAIAFVHCLRACGSLGAIEKGDEIHAEIARVELSITNIVVGNALIDMYVKCGCLEKACEVFDNIPLRDVVSWTTLITGYTAIGNVESALHLYEKMQIEGILPNAITYASLLSACSNLGAITTGQEIHCEIERQNLLEKDQLLGNALVDMYAKCGFLEAAQEAFDRLPSKDLVTWTALITGYVETGCCDEVFECYMRMQMEGITSDAVTILCILKACMIKQETNEGRRIHSEIACKGFLESDIAVSVALIDMYGKCGLLMEAEYVFNKHSIKDVVAWNALITSYLGHNNCTIVFDCFEQMKKQKIDPDSVTFGCLLKACGNSGAAGKGQEIHVEIVKGNFTEGDNIMCITLLDMYTKCGLPEKAQEVFDELPCRDVISYTALITGYSQLGELEKMFFFLNRMNVEGIKPNSITFISILTACCHAGLVDEGEIFFQIMIEMFAVNPTPEHLTCIVDLFGRAGQLENAISVVKKMILITDDSVWHVVLAACRRYGNVELGRKAFEYALDLDVKDVVAYVSLCNLYADGGIVAEVEF